MRISDWSSDVCSSDLPSKETLSLLSSSRSSALAPNIPPCSSSALPLYCADRPTRRSKPKACEKAARSIVLVKRSLVISSSDQKGLTCPTVTDSGPGRSEEHTSELQSLMRISYAVFCLKQKKE